MSGSSTFASLPPLPPLSAAASFDAAAAVAELSLDPSIETVESNRLAAIQEERQRWEAAHTNTTNGHRGVTATDLSLAIAEDLRAQVSAVNVQARHVDAAEVAYSDRFASAIPEEMFLTVSQANCDATSHDEDAESAAATAALEVIQAERRAAVEIKLRLMEEKIRTATTTTRTRITAMANTESASPLQNAASNFTSAPSVVSSVSAAPLNVGTRGVRALLAERARAEQVESYQRIAALIPPNRLAAAGANERLSRMLGAFNSLKRGMSRAHRRREDELRLAAEMNADPEVSEAAYQQLLQEEQREADERDRLLQERERKRRLLRQEAPPQDT